MPIPNTDTMLIHYILNFHIHDGRAFKRGRIRYQHPGWKRSFARTDKSFRLPVFTSGCSDLKWSVHAFFYGAKLPVQDNPTLYCSFSCTKQPRYHADCIDHGPIFHLKERSPASSRSKDQGARISRVEECPVTMMGIEGAIAHLVFSSWILISEKQFQKNSIITIQWYLRYLNTFYRQNQIVHFRMKWTFIFRYLLLKSFK